MSRGGRVRLVRPTRADKCAKLVGDVAREMAPACADSVRFFADGLADFITAPVSESADALANAVAVEGSMNLHAYEPELDNQFGVARSALIAAAQHADLQLPAELLHKPDVVTREAVRIEREALAAALSTQAHEGSSGPSMSQFAESLSREDASIRSAIQQAQLVAGRHSQSAHPVFDSVRDLLNADAGAGRESMRQQLAQWAANDRRDLERETAQSWSAVVLAACKLAMDDAGLSPSSPDLTAGVLTATDAAQAGGSLTVLVDPAAGNLEYETKGYSGQACQPVEERFIKALSRYLGAEFTAQNMAHWDTTPASEDKQPVQRRFTDSAREPEQRGKVR
jgi:hypothetical protein